MSTETTTATDQGPRFLVTPAARGAAFRLHRLTCKRAKAHPEVRETARTRETAEFAAATCCKPVMPATFYDKARERFSSAAAAKKAGHATKAAKAKAGVEKISGAEDEFVATMEAAIARVTSPDRPKRTDSPEYAEAMQAKKAGKRGPGKKLTDAEMDRYIAKARKARPTASRNEQRRIAYWVDGIALSRTRWNAAWARVTGGQA